MKYVIISLKHSSKGEPTFWREKNAGYTIYPFNAGQYTQEQIDAQPNYYNDGVNAIAVSLTDAAMFGIELKVKCNFKKLKEYHSKNNKVATT